MMRHRIPILPVLILILAAVSARADVQGLSSTPEPARTDSLNPRVASGSGRDARIRLGAGIAGQSFHVDDISMLYLSLNYRVSLAISPRDERAVGVGLEGGLNYLMPYLSFGPEVRVGNFAVTGDMGAIMLPGMSRIFPFANVGGGLISRHSGLGVEVNGGCLFVMGGADLIRPYIGISASFR